MIAPVLPAKSGELRQQLGLPPLEPRRGVDLWPSGAPLRAAGESLAPGGSLFPTLDEEGAKALLDRLTPRVERLAESAPPTTASATPASPVAEVAYDDLAKCDLRVGVVVRSERVPKKDKLLKLAVDLGEAEPRTIIAGLALSFQPEQLVGRRVIVVANLAPRDFGKGLISHGMLLATGPSDKLTLATIDGEAAPGAKLK
jgi:methionyl-tRNA synthetase